MTIQHKLLTPAGERESAPNDVPQESREWVWIAVLYIVARTRSQEGQHV